MALFVKQCGKSWRLVEQNYSKDGSVQKVINRESYSSLGFDRTWDLDKARKRAKEINRLSYQSRSAETSKLRILEKIRNKENIQSLWLPPDDVSEFEKRLESNNMGTADHHAKVLIIWERAKSIIIEVNAEPKFYSDYAQAFYNVFIKYNYSLDYSKKLLSLINRWGLFYCKTRGLFFENIRMPIAQQKKRIENAYKDAIYKNGTSRCRAGGSNPLTKEILKKLSGQLSNDQYDFMFISLWFGLRPNEIEGPDFSIYKDKVHEVEVLRIWQSKTESYKHIPILFPEQKLALKLLRPIKRPLNKTLRGITDDRRLTVYSGRKGFENLMSGLGRGLAEISAWLGHTSIRTTKAHYEMKDKVIITKAS